MGSIGRRHAKNFRALGCDVTTYDNGLTGALSGLVLEQALDGADGAVVCTPPESHVEIAWQALGAGCHLMIEKPVSTTLDDLTHLFRACENAGKTHMVAYPWRYDRSMNEKRARLSDIGAIQSWWAWYSYDTGNATAKTMGPLLDCSHALDFLRWLMGEPASLRVRDGDSGLTAKMDMRFSLAPGWAMLSLAVPMRCEGTIVGEHGAVDWLRHRDVDYDINDTYVTEAQHFLACIRGEAKPMTDGWDGMKTLRLALEAKRAAKDGEWRAL